MDHPAIRPGNVAVVTGAALGIGRALSRYLVARGMRVAMLDVDAAQLNAARAGIVGDTAAFLCDVAEIEALEHVRDTLREDWGAAPALLVNNAVTRTGRGMWAPLTDWQRAIQINLFGVVNGVRAFVPAMQAEGNPGAVVNVGSKQGITNPPGHPVYNMAKAAVRSFTEQLAHEFRQQGHTHLTAHLLVPGWTTTGLAEPKPGAWSPDQVVERLMQGLGEDRFAIICPDNEVTEEMDRARILWSARDLTEGRPALSRWHPDWAPVFAREDGSG